MQAIFCTHVSDEMGLRAIGIIVEKGFRALIIQEGESVPATAVAIFTISSEVAGSMPGHYLRLAAHRLLPHRPNWAIATPFVAALNGRKKNWDPEGFSEAVLNFAAMYEKWFAGGGQGFPWRESSPSEEMRPDFIAWQVLVKKALPLGNSYSAFQPCSNAAQGGSNRYVRRPLAGRQIK